MAKTKISEYDSTAANNTDINSINIDEGCSPSGINNAIRALMSHLKNWQGGTSGDALPVASGGTGSTTASDARTALGVPSIPAAGITKSNGTALSAATAGTDFVEPATATTFTAKQTFSGSSSTMAAKFVNALEYASVQASAAAGTLNIDLATTPILYYTNNATANFTLNFRASSGTSLNTVMAVNESVTFVFLNTNGSTAYYNNAITIDGTSVTPKYQGGAAFSSGTASSVDIYSYVIIKTASATFSVFVSKVNFA
jgi:hypothetical protein